MEKMYFNPELNTDQAGAIAFRRYLKIDLSQAPAEMASKRDIVRFKADVQRAAMTLVDHAEADKRDLNESESKAAHYAEALIDECNFQISRRDAEGSDGPIIPKPLYGQGGMLGSGGSREDRSVILTGDKRLYRDMFCQGEARGLDRGGFSSFAEFCEIATSGRHDPRLREARTFLEGTGTLGGFAVPEDFAAMIFDGALESEIVRPRAMVFPMKGPGLSIPAWDGNDHSGSTLFGGMQGVWMDENETADIQTGKLRLMKLTARKLACFSEASREAIADGLGLEAQVSAAMRKSVAFSLDTAFISGNGVAKPLGVLNAPSIVSVNRATASQISYNDILSMYARLAPGCLPNAVWIASSTCIPQLGNVRDTGNNNLWIQSATNGVPGTMLNLPILFTEKCPMLGSKGDIMLVDFTQYIVGMRAEMIFEQSNAPGWTRDVISYRCLVRVDGMPLWHEAITPLNGGDTLSWAVALDVP